MSEVAGSSSPGSNAPSVVIDQHAQVKVPRTPIYLAVAAVAALAAFTVVYFAVRNTDAYRPGPMAQAMLDSAKKDGITLHASDAELRCVDKNGAGLDPKVFTDSGFDPLRDTSSASPKEQEFIGTVLEDCLTKASRVESIAGSMAKDGTLTSEQSTCVASRIDDAFTTHGGYKQLMKDPTALFGVLGSMMSAFTDCKVDLTQMMNTGS